MTGVAAITSSPDVDAPRVEGHAFLAQRAVSRLSVTDFRNYQSARIELQGRSVVLSGANGAGKTNLLEALSFLTPGRGLRRAKLSEITRKDAGDGGLSSRNWAVAARIMGADGEVDLGTGLDPDYQGARERRIVRVDGETERAQSVLAEHISVVWLTPQMDGLFIDGPGARRRFLDRLVYATDPAHAGRVSAYEQAMRERARLLGEQGERADAAWLTAIEGTMVEKGMAVAAARRDMVGRLAAFIELGAGPFPGAELALLGGPEGWLDEGPALEAEERLRKALYDERSRDARDGRTNTGPHRTDLGVCFMAKQQEAALCSTGEQKALLITLVLAHARMLAAEQGCCPILLLDEVAAHLDQERRLALFDLLDELKTQVWMTGTDATLFEGMQGRADFFDVADGRVSMNS